MGEKGKNLENLRREIYNYEHQLEKHGFNSRRGIETYKISEINKIINNSQKSEQILNLIKIIITTQEALYRELYNSVGMKEMNVDTSSPEKSISLIKEKIIEKKSSPKTVKKNTKMKTSIEQILQQIEIDKDIHECANKIITILKRTYQRTYDHQRVLRYLLDFLPEKYHTGYSDKSILELASIFVRLSKQHNFQEIKKQILEQRRKR